jgi:hypothetical protein
MFDVPVESDFQGSGDFASRIRHGSSLATLIPIPSLQQRT